MKGLVEGIWVKKIINQFGLGLIEIVVDGIVGACMGFREFVEVEESSRVFGTHIRSEI